MPCPQVAASQTLQLYGHNVAESAVRGAVDRKTSIPRRRQTAEIVLQLDVAADSQFHPDRMGDYLQPHDLVPEGSGVLVPVWRVRLTAGPPEKHGVQVTAQFWSCVCECV